MCLEKPLDVALYASYEELQAMCHTWGMYGVREMALRSRTVLAEAFGTLDATLRMHEPILQRLKGEYMVKCRLGSAAFQDMPVIACLTMSACHIVAGMQRQDGK